MPRLFIFPRNRMKSELLNGSPPGSWGRCSDTGWMMSEIFFEWMTKFIKFLHVSIEKLVLLLLYGHSTHTKNLAVIDLAREHGVIMISFPPHCSHQLQPLDVSFMKPFSTSSSYRVVTFKPWKSYYYVSDC
ncbi:MFS-type transporter clz9 [Anthophora retusa]